MAGGRGFFSAALTAQDNPELHFRFINSFTQSSLLRSLAETYGMHADHHASLDMRALA